MKLPREIQTSINLRGIFPNPFNPVTAARYNLPQGEHVIVTVYEPLCHQVARSVNDKQATGSSTM